MLPYFDSIVRVALFDVSYPTDPFLGLYKIQNGFATQFFDTSPMDPNSDLELTGKFCTTPNWIHFLDKICRKTKL